MKKFILNIAIFSIAFFIFEKSFYTFLYISLSLEKDKRLEQVINGNINKDLIVLGSSRGARNVIASQIEDSLNMSAYNLSYPGSNIEFHEFLLRSLLNFNSSPKVILLVVDDPSELLPSESIDFRLGRLYPLAKYDYINNEMIKRGEKTFLSKLLVLARINKRNFDIRKKQFSSLDTIKANGSMPISFQRKNIEFTYDSTVTDYNTSNELPSKIDAFLKFQEHCIEDNIKLYIVFPPNFKAHNISFERRLREISHSEVEFLIFNEKNDLYKDKSYFYDRGHLKSNGATIFTNEIIKRLNKDLNS